MGAADLVAGLFDPFLLLQGIPALLGQSQRWTQWTAATRSHIPEDMNRDVIFLTIFWVNCFKVAKFRNMTWTFLNDTKYYERKEQKQGAYTSTPEQLSLELLRDRDRESAVGDFLPFLDPLTKQDGGNTTDANTT